MTKNKIVSTMLLREATIVAEFKGEKIVRDMCLNYYYVPPKQPLEEKAILIPFSLATQYKESIENKRMSYS